jgi:hypothetical protein
MFEMDPDNPMARLFYAGVLALNGLPREAIAIAETFPTEVRDTVPARVTRLLAHGLAGDRSAALAALTPEIEEASNATDLFPRFLAIGFIAAGMPERAIHWLSIAVDRGFINYPFLAHNDSFVKPLRDDPQFQQLLATVRERWEKFEP